MCIMSLIPRASMSYSSETPGSVKMMWNSRRTDVQVMEKRPDDADRSVLGPDRTSV